MNRSHIIYVVTSPSGKTYIGQTVYNLNKRWVQHCSLAKKGSTYPICKAIRKYGKDAFKLMPLIENIPSLDEANTWEILMIRRFNSDSYVNGYNCTPGGGGNKGSKHRLGRKHTEASKRKMSKAQKGHKNLVGYKRSNEAKLNMSLSKMGHEVSEETRRKISDSLRGRKQDPEIVEKRAKPLRGKPRSKETREKISKALMGNKNSLGYTHGLEARQKISKSQRGANNSYSKSLRRKQEESECE